MPSAIFSTNAGIRAIFKLGRHGQATGSPAQQVHDGDTINVQTDVAHGTNFGVRFLGVDTPEISFHLPGSSQFLSTDHQGWQDFLDDPFARTAPFVSPALQQHLQGRIGPGTAVNHHRHAELAEDALERMIVNDMTSLGQDKDTFGFFLAFSNEVMEGFGRLLCFINRNQPDANQPTPRPHSYNERELEEGVASAYFIWPNVDPFRRQPSVVDAVPQPMQIPALAGSGSLGRARAAVQNARQQSLGIFEAADPLRLEPFELRFLARRSAPNRWVIDLTSTSNSLLRPEDYRLIPNAEDRLFVPAEYVPLFVASGWVQQ